MLSNSPVTKFQRFTTPSALSVTSPVRVAGLSGTSRQVPSMATTSRPAHRGVEKDFHVLSRRWVVERTFGWLMQHRRLPQSASIDSDY